MGLNLTGYAVGGTDNAIPAPRQPLGHQLEETNDVLCEAVNLAFQIRHVIFGDPESVDNAAKDVNVPCIENVCDRIDEKARNVRNDLRDILARING